MLPIRDSKVPGLGGAFVPDLSLFRAVTGG